MIIKNPICAPSTVNWCEHDYAVSPYIAEFWNTLSGVSILLSAIVWGFYMYPLNKTLTKVFIWLVIVSIGTSLFHATLLYKYQLLDELPMLVIAMEYVNILLKLNSTRIAVTQTKLHLIRTASFIGRRVVFAIPFTYFLDPFIQIGSFHLTLKIFEIIIIFLLRQLHLSLNHTFFLNVFDHIHVRGDDLHKYKASSPFTHSQSLLHEYIQCKRQITFHTTRGVIMYSSSILLWLVERLFCKHVEFLQLHAWWHILSSIGMFHLNMIFTFHMKISNMIENIEKNL
jgi:hypothetical protein